MDNARESSFSRTASLTHLSTIGPILVLDHLVELTAGWALLLLCASLGVRVLSRFRLDATPGERLFLAVPLGAGVLATGMLGLGFAGGFRPIPIMATMLLVAILAAPGLLPTLRATRRFVVDTWTKSPAVVVLLAAVLLAMTVQASAPPTDWDSLIYHLEVPSVWLEEGKIFLPEDNLHAAFVGLWHMLYVPVLAIGADSAPAILNAVTGCLLAVGLMEFGRRWFGGRTGRVASVVTWGSPILVLVAVTARVDVVLALFLLAAHHAAFAALYAEAPSKRWGVLAAVLLGLGVGIKLLAVPYLAALAPVAVLLLRRKRLDPINGWVVAGVAFIAAALPWLVQKWQLFGDPVYPLLSERLLEPWLRPLYGGDVHAPPAVSLAFARAEWLIVDRLNFSDFFFAPRFLTHEGEGGLYLGNLLFLILPLWLMRLQEERLNLVIVGALVYAALVIGPDLKVNLRYLIPSLILLSAGSARLLVWTEGRVRWDRAASLLSAALVGLILARAVLPIVSHWSRMPTVSHLTGQVSAESYLKENENPDVYLYGPLVAWVNHNLGPSERALLIFEGRGFYLEPPVIQDNLLANWPLLSAKLGEADCLEELGVTHVIVNYGVLSVYLEHGIQPERLAWNRFPDFARRCLERVDAMEGYVVYRISE